MTSGQPRTERSLGVAEAKRRFSELLDRVERGERIVISRRGKAAVVLAPPGAEGAMEPRPAPLGLAAGAGVLADWDEFEDVVEEIYRARRRARDRPAPEFD
jgi:prevent-host-death family protein